MTAMQISWALQLGAGILGAFSAWMFVRSVSLGLLGSVVVGAAGGALGAVVLNEVYGRSVGGGLDLVPVLGNLASGGLGGGVTLLALGGVIAIARWLARPVSAPARDASAGASND
ncbi:MAG: hypothetical protein AAGF32_02630 [Pseudomonadota bacterium]